MKFAAFLIFLSVLWSARGAVLPVEEDSSFDCAGLPTEFLAGDPGLIVKIQQACAADVHCAALFAQEELADPTTFSALLQISEPHADPLSYQAPMLDILCGKTVEEALALMWTRSLIVAVRRLHICAPDEQFILSHSGAEASCQPMLHSTYNSPGNYYGYIIAALVCIVILLACICARNLYQFLRNA